MFGHISAHSARGMSEHGDETSMMTWKALARLAGDTGL
jgi:hypothetical protein